MHAVTISLLFIRRVIQFCVMNRLYKTISLLCLATLLAGCSYTVEGLQTATTELPAADTAQSTPTDTESAESEAAETQIQDEVSSPETDTPDPAAGDAPAEAEGQETPDDPAASASPDADGNGQITDGTYINEQLGITFTPPADMTFADEKDMQQIAMVSADTYLEKEDLETILNDETIRMLCYAAGDSSSSPVRSFNITVQDISGDQNFTDTPLSESALIADLIEKIEAPLSRQDFTDIRAIHALMPFLGSLHPCMILSASVPETGTMYERVVCVKLADSIVSVTASCIGDEDTTKEILDQVRSVKDGDPE